MVNAYIEIVPTDAVKYQLDKPSGHLRVDRPQRFSSMCPTPYGFIPQTFCGVRWRGSANRARDAKAVRGDGDPLDICVLTERPAAHGDFFVRARPSAACAMIDGNEADDKIIRGSRIRCYLRPPPGHRDAPAGLIDRLKHYFPSYKQLPQEAPRRVEMAEIYNREGASEVFAGASRLPRQRHGAGNAHHGVAASVYG